MAVDCDDGVACTDDSCNEGSDSCDNVSNDANCDNGLFCDGIETCDELLDCQAGGEPCEPGESCDEITDECRMPGDIDGDSDIDLDDYAVFGDCLAGPSAPPNPTLPGLTVQDCLNTFDLDADSDVDLQDFTLLLLIFTN